MDAGFQPQSTQIGPRKKTAHPKEKGFGCFWIALESPQWETLSDQTKGQLISGISHARCNRLKERLSTTVYFCGLGDCSSLPLESVFSRLVQDLSQVLRGESPQCP
jgi:hypothetical protein